MLSPRLQTIYDCIPFGSCVADVGTDHGYLAVELVKTGKSPKVIASDINQKPLDKARQRIIMNNLVSQIDVRLGSGLSTIKVDECDFAVIAGMGGHLICDILKADEQIAKQLQGVVLQPMSNSSVLRQYLCNSGFQIIGEFLAQEDEKIYEIIVAQTGVMSFSDEIETEIGYSKVRQFTPLFDSFINQKIQATRRTLKNVENKKTKGACEQQKKSNERLVKLMEVKHVG